MMIEPLPFQTVEIVSQPIIYNCPRDWQWRPPLRDYYNLWICLEGQAAFRIGNEAVKSRPWSAFVFSPNAEVFAQTEETETRLSNFSVHWKSQDGEIDRALPIWARGIEIREVDTARSLIQSMIRLSAFNDSLSVRQQELSLLQLLSLLWREGQTPVKSAADSQIYQQIERLRSGQDLFVSVDDLAEEVHLSRIHYSRCFRRITGESPNRYLIKQRIERACMLLRGTDWSAQAVAESIGYPDAFFFNRQFRATVGESPLQYRKRMAEVSDV